MVAVECLEVEYEPLGVARAIDATGVGGDDHADLRQLLDHMYGGGLGAAVDHRHLHRAQLLEAVAEQQLLAAALRSHQQEGVPVGGREPGPEEVQAALHVRRQDQRQRAPSRQLRDLQVVGDLRKFNKGKPLYMNITCDTLQRRRRNGEKLITPPPELSEKDMLEVMKKTGYVNPTYKFYEQT